MKTQYGLLMGMVVLFLFVGCQKKVATTQPSAASLKTIYFDYDRSYVRSDAVATLQGNAAYLKQNPNSAVAIEGNCDNRGTNEYNLALGQRRADSTRDYLVNLGMSSARMKTVSYGEEKPACYQNEESCWQRNRRADFRQ